MKSSPQLSVLVLTGCLLSIFADTTPVSLSTPGSATEDNLESKWEHEITMHILTVLEGLSSKVTVIEGWGQQIQNTETQVVGIEYRMGEKINNLKDRLSSVENRSEDKILKVEEKLEAKFEELKGLFMPETIVAAVKDELSQFTVDLTASVKSDLDTIKQDLIDVEVRTVEELRNVTGELENNIYEATYWLESAGNNITGNIVCSPTTDNTDVHLESFTNQTTTGLINLEYSLRKDIEKIQIPSTLECPTGQPASVPYISGDLETLTQNLVKPSRCERGMTALPSQTTFPYPVVYPSSYGSVETPYLCDTHTLGGGWIVIQRRTSGNVDFYRGWEDYKNGFGSFDDDFWLGLENVHQLTKAETYELRVELKFQKKNAFAQYENFSISNEENNYSLQLGAFEADGTAGDGLGHQHGLPFTTPNNAHDSDSDCATKYHGAWWYDGKLCSDSNLNGKWNYLIGGNRVADNTAVWWKPLTKYQPEPVTFSEMKIRLMSARDPTQY